MAKRNDAGTIGRVIETVGRRVRVEDDAGTRVCILSGHRAVLGDQVRWIPIRGGGGKITDVEPRDTALCRLDQSGREQVLAANLGGLLVVAAVQQPPFRAGLVDRYLAAAWSAGLEAVLVLNKCDLGVPDDVEAEVALRAETGVRFLRASAHTHDGLDGIQALLADEPRPWALVGHSGVGKTSLIAALLPDIDAGPVGDLSEYWGTGTHTTTRHRLFRLPDGGEIVDSPGIRTFTPAGLSSADVRRHFPGMSHLQCRYRACLHQGEEGCRAPEEVAPGLLASYHRLLEDVLRHEARQRR